MNRVIRVMTMVWVGAGVVAVGAQSRAGAPQPVSDSIRSAWDTAKKMVTPENNTASASRAGPLGRSEIACAKVVRTSNCRSLNKSCQWL